MNNGEHGCYFNSILKLKSDHALTASLTSYRQSIPIGG